jgi:hypothetical protein
MLPQRPREGAGAPVRPETFKVEQPKPGTSWHGYIAGPCLWFECHQPRVTKPCLAILTDRAVPCPWCVPGAEIVWRGYQPVYRASDWAPRSVILSDLYRDVTDGLVLHQRVTVGKEGDPSDPVWITRAVSQAPKFVTTLKHRWREIDMTPTLLALWGSPGLREWYAKYMSGQGAPPAEQKPPGVAVTSGGDAFSPMMQAAARRAGCEVVPPADLDGAELDADAAFLRDVQLGAKPSKNGKHKLPPKG